MSGPATSSKRPSTPKRTRGRPTGAAHVGFDSLLRGARQVFARQGYEATSVREIARVAGVDPALMAHHFGSKEGLWTAVVGQLAAQLTPLIETLRQLRGSRMSQVERLRQALILYVDFLFENPDIGMFFSTAATEQGDRLDLLMERLVRPYRDAFLPLLTDAIAAGKLKRHDPDLLEVMIVNAINNTVSYSHLLARFSNLPAEPEKFKQGVLDIALAMFQ
ncbi:MAG TPA: TetR/AcrR family transcriptional regulator [Paraburkholderia sp.]|uniref:TetR/AcrR family transcriptional regulator n=1 Tax=Paraburkholderia sp. TaxID=1926495 RepID=UPI002B461DB2|nr:TetR/AcrR family transcriptional regulator [Paraburkholderia sp.]HKR39441.1 TetR/AcrR family transcriptional regulator [Paraburkholderia sp.]